jgi:hypothetical protein
LALLLDSLSLRVIAPHLLWTELIETKCWQTSYKEPDREKFCIFWAYIICVMTASLCNYSANTAVSEEHMDMIMLQTIFIYTMETDGSVLNSDKALPFTKV